LDRERFDWNFFKTILGQMEEKNVEISFRANDKIEYRIPESLILRKSDDPSKRDITVYDLIAHHAGLRYVNQDIYVNESGVEYVRTKFGFESAVRHNFNIQLNDSARLIEDLQYKLKIAQEKVNKYAERILAYETDRAGQKEKLKKRIAPFRAENNSFREQIKLLKTELNEFRQLNDSVISRLSILRKAPGEKSELDQTLKSELDWSAFDDLLDENEI
jgi:hypothetical protein